MQNGVSKYAEPDPSQTLSPSAQVARTNYAGEVVETLRQAIVTGKLRPNQRLVESRIARQLGVSRTPVREAFKLLETKGYLSKLPSGGMIVTDHSPGQIRDLYEIREAVETMAIRLACQRVTEEQLNQATNYHNRSLEVIRNRDVNQFIDLNSLFHTELLDACGNEPLRSLVHTHRDQSFDRRIARVLGAKDWRAMYTEHGQILEAVGKRNPNLAEKAVRNHIRTAMRIALERL